MDRYQDRYRAVLFEIKRRTEVLDGFLFHDLHAIYVPTTAESACLQIRKILELIAFGSLVANVEIYSAQHSKFAEHWNARLLLRDMARLNPDFYPRPILQKPSTTPGVASDWEDITDGYLTQSDFEHVYEKCGAILHAENPFGGKVDYDFYLNEGRVWRQKIVTLMDAHIIRLLNDDSMYLFQMGAGREAPSYTPFAKATGLGA